MDAPKPSVPEIMMNWVYMWFKEGGPVSREDYANVATTLILEGVKKVK